MDTERPELPQPSRELEPQDEGFLAELDNGLKIFVVPDPFTTLMEFDMRVSVGSRDDPIGKAAMAHFVEHLMFQMKVDGEGSPKLMTDLASHTLFFNAFTAPDYTHYMQLGTGEELETFMKYTQLRLGYECEEIPEAEFMRERDVVRNEHRWRGTNVDAEVMAKVLELAYPEGHPYREQRFADIDPQVASITPADTCDFIKKYYTASQATVVVTGNVDPLEVLDLAKKYLSDLPKVDAPPREKVPPAKFQTQQAEIVAPVKKPTAMVLFKTPPRFTREYIASQAALQTMFLAVSFFTGGRSSAVERWYPVFQGGEQAPLFGVAVETEKARDLDRAIDEVLDAITRGFSPELKGKDGRGSYDQVLQRTRLDVLDQFKGVSSRGVSYADYLAEGTNAGFYGADLAEIQALTPEHAQSTGRKLFAREGAMVVKAIPDGSKEKPKTDRAAFDYKPSEDERMSVPEDIDPAEAHRSLEIGDSDAAEGQSLEYELDNGMRVILVQSTSMPVMDVQVIVGGGLEHVPQNPDIARNAVNLFSIAEGDRDASNLLNFFYLAGGVYGQNVGTHASTFNSRGLSIYLDFIIAGLAEQVVNGAYQTGALDGWKLRRKDQLDKKFFQQAASRTNAFSDALYGPGHPHVRHVIDNPKDLREVKLRDIEAFRDQHFRGANSAIIITGGFDMELAIAYVDAFFGKPVLRDRDNPWLEPSATPAKEAVPEPAPGTVRVLTEIDKERVQTDVRIGYPLREAYGDDHAALMVMAEMLNFGVSAVRQKLGASYGVYARLVTGQPRIEAGGALDSARAGEGLAAIVAAVADLREGKDFDRRFAYARRTVLRNMVNAQGDPQLLSSQVADAVRNGRSYDYHQKLAQRVAALKPEQVKKIASKVLVQGRSVTMVQGPKDGVDNAMSGIDAKAVKALPDVVHDERD